MPTNKEIAERLQSYADDAAALAAIGDEVAGFVAELISFAATTVRLGKAPADVLVRLKDLSADMVAVRAEEQAKADEKFGRQP